MTPTLHLAPCRGLQCGERARGPDQPVAFVRVRDARDVDVQRWECERADAQHECSENGEDREEESGVCAAKYSQIERSSGREVLAGEVEVG